MNDDDTVVDQMLTRWAEQQRRDAGPVPATLLTLSGRDRSGSPRRSSQWLVPAAAAASVVVLLAGVTLAVAAARDNSSRARVDTPAKESSIPAGWQVVSSLGLEVSAPGDWPVNSWAGCGPGPAALIERDQGGVAGCGSNYVVPSVLRIRMLQSPTPGASPAPTSEASAESTSVDLGAAPGTVTRGRTADGRFFARVQVPELQAEVSVESPDEKIVDAIVGSVRAVDVDSVGCPTRLGPTPAWDRAAPGPAVNLSGQRHVVSIGVCHYQRTRPGDAATVLASSKTLTGPEADAAVAAIEASQAGALPAVPETQCVREPESNPLWLHVAYSDGAEPVPVHVRYSTCEERWTASPSGVSQVSEAQLRALLGPLHTGYGFSSGIPTR